MKLKITGVVNDGTHASERVVLSVSEDADLMYFIIRDTTYLKDGKISNKWNHSYHFVSHSVTKGDEVVVYTGKGTNKVETLGMLRRRHVFYWGLDNFVWNNDKDGAVLYQLSDWSTFKVN